MILQPGEEGCGLTRHNCIDKVCDDRLVRVVDRHRHEVAPPKSVMICRVIGQEPLGGRQELDGLRRRHRLLGSAGTLPAPGLDLHKDYFVFVDHHEIEFSGETMPVACNESIAVRFEMLPCYLLPPLA